jgi:hypothetical protein
MGAVRRLLPTVLAAATLTAVLSGALAACGGDPYADYCGSVKEHRARLSRTLDSGGQQALLAALPTFEALRRDAPSDIADDWATLTTALDRLRGALAAAHVDPATYDRAAPPAGLSQAERSRIDAAAAEVGSVRTRAALAAVDQQARDVCHQPLTL